MVAPRALVSLLALTAALGACSGPPGAGEVSAGPSAQAAPGVASGVSASGTATAAAVALDGKALVERFQCNRCHDGTGLADADETKSCVSCHQSIAAKTFKADPKLLAAWRPHVMALRFAPSLSGIGTLVRPAWAKQFLLSPHDLRPALEPMMPRLALSDAEAEAIVAWLASQPHEAPPDEPPTGDVERGRGLFASKGCDGCHVFGGSGLSSRASLDPTQTVDHALAPDLRFARERVLPGRLVAYLLEPGDVKAGAAMPKQALSRAEAQDLARFVLEAPLTPPATVTAPARLPPLTREVRYDEVAERVLHKICWHCHSQPDYARGDGGPGNTGGFGFAPRLADLSSYESIAAGYLDARGERRSLLSAQGDRPPPLVEALYARQTEMTGGVAAVRGMPLGLPPLSAEDIQLVESWVAQGHPR